VVNRSTYEIWYYYGDLERDDLIAAGLEDGDLPSGQVAVRAIVTMINGIVIKAALNPLADDTFPFDFMPWQRRTGMPYGRGVAWQMQTPQRMLNAAGRSMLENLGLSSGPQIVMNRQLVRPADGVAEITPRKLWHINTDPTSPGTTPKAADVFSVFNIPSQTNESMAVINFSMKLAEDVTGLPMLMQGQQGAAPDTVGGMTILNNNASTVLRRIARSQDDHLTEPQIMRYYEWLMEYGENEAAKDDLTVDAHGSTALVERELSAKNIMQMGALVVNPAFGTDPELWFDEAAKAQKLDPKRFKLTDEKKAAMAAKGAPPMPQVEVAKINAEARAAIAKGESDAETQRLQMKLGSEQQEFSSEDATKRYLAEQANSLRWETALLEFANREKLSLEDAKTRLTIEISKLNTQTALSGGARPATPQVAEPAFEPLGRAQPGQAFQQ